MKQKGTFSSFIIRLCIGATALSVAVMIVAVAISTGFKYAVREKLYSFIGHINIEQNDPTHSNNISPDPITLDPQLINKIKSTPHVLQVAPFAQGFAIVEAHKEIEGALLKGVNADFRFLPGISFEGKKIDYSDTSYSKQVILSDYMANKLNITIGDKVRLYFMNKGAMPRIRNVEVAGLYHTGAQDEIDSRYLICDVRLLQRINNWAPNQVNYYQVDLDDDKYMDTTADIIYQEYLSPTSPLAVYTTRDIYPGVFDWLGTQDVETHIILIILGIVAIINLGTTLIILILEQARLIGVLKALGMAFGKIRRIFMYHAALIAGTGILAGNVFALGLCVIQQKTGFIKLKEDTYYMKHVPIRLHWWQVAGIDAATLVVCMLCMWAPTLYIRYTRPARILQFK